MKKSLLTGLLLLSLTPSVAAADNIANCEVVLMETVQEGDTPTNAEIASFRPAAEFMASIYDDEDGHVKDIDGYPIRGVLCQRANVMPTLRDFPIVATGIPFSLSENFDSPDSRLVTVYFKDGEFHHKYAGEPLTDDDQEALEDILFVFNLQGLDPDTDQPKEKQKDTE